MLPTRTLQAAIGLGLLIALGCAPRQPELPSTEQTRAGPVVQDGRFSGSVQIQTPRGPESRRVEVINVDMRGGHTIERLVLAFEGTLMAYLQAGEVTTTINGKREERRQGQIWTVPPGVAMALATGRDTASLQVILVEK